MSLAGVTPRTMLDSNLGLCNCDDEVEYLDECMPVLTVSQHPSHQQLA